jgi:Domain of unknown function (DUF4388)
MGGRAYNSRRMVHEGSLTERDLPGLMQSLYEERWSGLLTLTSAGIGKNVNVQEGRMVFASSSSVDDRLGELLLRRGRLTLAQFLDASAAIVPGKRLGTVLVEQGVLTPKELVTAVVDQTREIIYSLFLWTEGRYRLQEGPPSSEVIKLNLSTPDMIMEGIRRIDAWSRIERAVGGRDALYERAQGYEQALGPMTLSADARALVDTLTSPRSVAEICRPSSMADFDVCKAIWAFRVVGILRRQDAPERASAPAVHDDDGLGSVLSAGD